jgi:hypothetical protein
MIFFVLAYGAAGFVSTVCPFWRLVAPDLKSLLSRYRSPIL